jgi:hypothetical protein
MSAAVLGTPVPGNAAASASLDADGAVQIASPNCEAYLLTQRRVGDWLCKHQGDLNELTRHQLATPTSFGLIRRLAEMLRQKFNVELPAFASSSVEEYFSKVAELNPRKMIWRVRRQVAIGVFPSARMAMYNDLDTDQSDFPKSKIVESLLGGTNAESASPFGEEYEVDHPDIEGKVPCLVMDADSSQFSTLVDIAEGRNLAVEGPPGTGKSQTIVNAIAAALADGKKVLFVAEKLAALNVVKSRLEAVGLGEFLLPLQAERSTREQVIASVRERIEMRSGRAVRGYDAIVNEYRRTRQQIAKYIDLMTRHFGDCGLTVREILGKSIATNPSLSGLPPEFLEKCKVPQTLLTVSGLESLRKLGARVTETHREANDAQPYWKATRLLHPDRFTIEEACDLASRASRAFSGVADARDKLTDVGLPSQASSVNLSEVDDQLEQAELHIRTYGADLLINLLRDNNAAVAQRFIDRCEACNQQRGDLSRVLTVNPDAECVELIDGTAEMCERLGLSTIDPYALSEEVQKKREFIEMARSLLAALTPLVENRPESSGWSLADIARACALLQEAGRDALLSRNARTNERDAPHVLQQLCSYGKELQAQKAKLADKVSFAVELSVEGLYDTLSTIRVAGRFSFFSSRYRRAKRLFRAISRAPKYDNQDAVNTLEALIDFRRRESEFNQHPDVTAAFGSQFRGVETDFERFERLGRFYASVGSHFGSRDKSSLRRFLREADVFELELIPAVPLIDATITYESLRERIAAAGAEVRNLEEALTGLLSCVHVFSDPKTVEPGKLVRLTMAMRELMEEEATLDGCSEARLILGGAFDGSRTSALV